MLDQLGLAQPSIRCQLLSAAQPNQKGYDGDAA